MTTWNVVQSASNAHIGTSVTATFGGNAGANNKIIATVASTWTDVPVTVRDAALNDLTFCGSAIGSDSGVWLYAMDVPPGDVGTPVAITATWGSSNNQSLLVQEVAGLAPGDTAPEILDYNPGTLTTGTTATTGSPVYGSTEPGEYLVCVYGTGDNSTVTAANGTWTLDPNSSTAGGSASLEYKDSSGGTETGGFNNARTDGWAVLMVAFQVAGESLPDPWQFLQSASGSAFGTTVTATFTNNVAAGNKIIVAFCSDIAPTTVRDAALNNWTLIGSAFSTIGVWLYALDVPAGDVGTKPAITATVSGSHDTRILIQEVAGLITGNTTAMRDGTPGTLTGTATTTGSPSYTSAAANEYLVCVYGSANAAAPAAVAGYVLDAHSGVDSDSVVSLEYKNSTSAAETSGWTGAAASGWAVLTVAFQLLPAAISTAPAWAASQNTTAVGGTGTWTNPGNATGPADTVFATWTAP